jgi:Domain of unknown function (DUF4177)
MKKFEYKVLKVQQEGFWSSGINGEKLVTHLNTLGLHGWELTSTVETNAYYGKTNEVILFLKREIVL